MQEGKASAKTHTDHRTIPVAERWFGSWRLSLHRRPLSRREVQTTYDAQAAGWNKALSTMGTEAAYRAICAEAAHDLTVRGPGQPLRVLDAGSGTGAFSSAFVREAPHKVQLHALDTSPHMLAEAKRTYRTGRIQASLHLGDIRILPFEDDSLDVILSAHVLEHLANPQAALAEMVRVLRPGGTLLIIGTRASAASLAIQMHWRTHGFKRERLAAWIASSGATDIERIKPKAKPLFNQISLAFAAKKPLYIPLTDY